MSFEQLTDRLDVDYDGNSDNLNRVQQLKDCNFEPVISKDRNSKMLESKDKE